MRLARLAPVAVLAASAALAGALAAPATAHLPRPGHGAWPGENAATRLALTTKAPYEPQQPAWSYQPAPAGFTPVFTENVSRHGARTLSSSSDGNNILALVQIAQADGGLTGNGAGLAPEVQQLLAANAKIGYGLLTQSGKDALASTAVRMEQRLPGLFRSATATASSTPRIDVTSSNIQRAIDSSQAFVSGLKSADPALATTIAPDSTNNNLLYFHKAAANKDYQNYVKNDPRVAAAEARARALPQTDTAARSILARSFTPAFVDEIAAGDFAAQTQLTDLYDAAEALYNLWAVTADMPDEGHWHMGRYLTRQGEDWFGYLDDVTSFYENGPAFAGDTITYKMANILLNDMFADLDAKRNGTSSLVADLRFTHAEEIFPLATLLGLPGSTEQLPAGTLFSYTDDPFRGAEVAPMAANVQWDLFKRGSTYLVRMLYNEKQTAFKSSCTPIRPGSYFYDLTSLESCYGYTPAS